jgi:hypothetical protein
MSTIHVTLVQGRDVYGHETSHCDQAGCAGDAQYFPGVDGQSVSRGDLVELGGDTTPTKTPWREVPVCDSSGDLEIGSAEWVAALTEYREHGTMSGCWPCTREELGHDPDDDGAEAGLSVDEIDWTGFGPQGRS